MVARCAGKERYFAFINLIFSRLESWARTSDPVGALGNLAKLGGMSQQEFEACLQNPDMERAVLNSRLTGAQAFEVDSTPTLIINGRKHAGGLSFEDFKAVVDPLIAAAGK